MAKHYLAQELTDYLYNRLPSVYRNTDYDELLKRFIEIFVEGGFNPLLQETMKIMDLIDVDKCPVEFLPQLCAMYGYEYSLELPELFQRRLLKYIVDMYRRKGTKSVVRFIARELTGYESEIIENKDFTPYDVEVTGWTVEFKNYRNFILKLTAPYESYSMYNKEEIVVKLVNEFLPTNSQAFIITSYWFDDESKVINTSKDFNEFDKVVDKTDYTLPFSTSTQEDIQILKQWIVETTESKIFSTAETDTNKVIMSVESYIKNVITQTGESIDTIKIALATEPEILPVGSTTVNSYDIMREKNEEAFNWENPELQDETYRLNTSTLLYTNTISGFDTIKQSGQPDTIIII